MSRGRGGARPSWASTALPFVARRDDRRAARVPRAQRLARRRALTRHERVHLGIAVSLGEDGLIVPVIRDAQELSVEGLAARIKDVARRARARRACRPTTSAAGRSRSPTPGSTARSWPRRSSTSRRSAILDLEAIVKRPVVVTDADGNDSIAIRPMTNLGLSWDHRALDGALAAQFLAALQAAARGP